MRTSILLSGIIILSMACKKSGQKACTTPPQPVLVRLVNASGTDLLDPSKPSSYKVNAMNLFYLDNGANRSTPIAINSFPSTDIFFLSNEMNWLSDKGRTYYLNLSPTDTDTIYVRVDKQSQDGCSFFSFKEFKYNGVSYNPKTILPNQPQVFEVVK